MLAGYSEGQLQGPARPLASLQRYFYQADRSWFSDINEIRLDYLPSGGI